MRALSKNRAGWQGAQRALVRCGATLLALLLLSACGDDEADVVREVPQAATETESEEAAGAETEEAENVVTTMIQEIDRHQFPQSARDPFMAPILREDERVSAGPTPPPECDTEVDPLGLTPPTSLSLIGLVTGTAVPKAMFYTGGGGQAIIVTEGARVGPRCSARIAEIRDNEVVIETRSLDPNERTRVSIMLHEDLMEGVEILD